MTGQELRNKFIQYFKDRQHAVISSYPLVPKNDPTLLFTNAGMVQFKDIFLGDEKREYNRAVTVQKCVRAGGKHNDLEMVGRTARHHTFFEMLGNFSFGDYFKKEAIQYGWEFLTEVIGLPRDRLYISVFQDDDEAFNIWANDMKMPRERIYRMGEKDNFWAMGPTGPCGPCSEIFIDQGKVIGCGKPSCAVGCDCDRYLEIWNLVFMQYDRDASGKLTPLPKPSIDTGMGLERLAAVVQGRTTNYDTDLMMSIINESGKITGREYGINDEVNVSLRVLTDHARAATFLIGDGVIPSNEGRGYVLRKVIRRALRHGKLLGQKNPFFHKITSKVIEDFKTAYPDLTGNSNFIHRVVLNEEESFGNTLHFGTQRLEEILQKVHKENLSSIPGEEIFKLYDTYGFPTDLVEETAKEAFRIYMTTKETPVLPGFISGGGNLFGVFFKSDEEKRLASVILDSMLKMFSRIYENFDEAITGALNDTIGRNWHMNFLRSFGNNVSQQLKGQLGKAVIPTTMSGRSQYDVRKTAFPEAESLFNAMDYVHSDEFEPADVHGRNVMVRQGTNELVIVDLGLFDLMRK